MKHTAFFKLSKSVLLVSALIWATSGYRAFAENDIKLGVSDKGMEIDAGAMGKFLLNPPFLSTVAGTDKGVQGVWKAGDQEGEMVYPNGTKLTCKIKKSEIVVSFKDLPREGEPKFMFIMSIPLSFGQGGKFKFEEKKLQDFPADIQTEQFIVTGISSDFSFVDKAGNGLTFEVKSNWYGLQDNRVFRSNEYSYQFLIDLKAVSGNGFVIKIKPFKP